jgi:hypothetical protein
MGHFATNPLSQDEIDSAKVLLDRYGADESMPDLLRRAMARLIVEIESNPHAPEELKRQARLAKKRATGDDDK